MGWERFRALTIVTITTGDFDRRVEVADTLESERFSCWRVAPYSVRAKSLEHFKVCSGMSGKPSVEETRVIQQLRNEIWLRATRLIGRRSFKGRCQKNRIVQASKGVR